MSVLESVRRCLDASHSCYHAIAQAEKVLLEAGFSPLYEAEEWKLEEGKKYYVNRNGSSLIAFIVPSSSWKGVHIAASHSDSPTFKIKHNPVVNQSGELGIRVEKYGGMIISTWFDRPLSFAGRVIAEKDGNIRPILFDIDEDLAVIPNLCIHFSRDINDGHAYSPDSEIIPLFGSADDSFDWKSYLEGKADLKEGESIVDEDLFLYSRVPSSLVGKDKEYLCSARLDNLTSAFTSVLAISEASSLSSLPICAIFDNEEVGSFSYQGAGSDFLRVVLSRVMACLGREFEEEAANSFMLSVDNAHARHPNYPGTFERTCDVKLNGGIVLKYNAALHYTTDAISSSVVRLVAKKADVPVQTFSNRPDIRGGGTLGNISMTQLSIPTADIGLAQLAMHSSYETMGVKDIDAMHRFIREFFESSIRYEREGVEVK
ncbi:MAG: M18 family aminopeptidase [Bacilli bacterium]|nr:M18 family aminopeptidase [Bacilli bacterium]